MNEHTGTRRRSRRVLGLSLGSAMIMAMVPGVASAQTQPDAIDTSVICGDVDANFNDIRGSAHEYNIRCMADFGLTEGTRASGGASYAPRQDVTRGQMASFIARFIEDYTGEDLPEGESDRFDDVPATGYVHGSNIQNLAEIGVVEGTNASGGQSYAPNAAVTRAQMASFIRRSLSYVENGEVTPLSAPPAGVDAFPDDDGSVHEANINAIAGVRIVQGFDDGDYRPQALVKRDQMASFVMRAYAWAESEGLGGPMLVSSVPADGATDVPVTTQVSGTFNQELSDESDAALVCDDADVPGTASVDGDTIEFEPTAPLPFDADCDATFVAIDADEEWETTVSISFTTAAALNVTATTDETAVEGGTLDVTFAGDVDEVDALDAAGECIEDDQTVVLEDGVATIAIAEDSAGECTVTFTVTYHDDSVQDDVTVTFTVLTEQEALQAEVDAAEATDPEPVAIDVEEDVEELEHEQFGHRVDLGFDPRDVERILWVQNETVYDQTDSGAEALYLNREMPAGTEITIYYQFDDGSWETIEIVYGEDGTVATINGEAVAPPAEPTD